MNDRREDNRRGNTRGRRKEDNEVASFCLEHSGFRTDIATMKIAVKDHTDKLGKFFGRINAVLITVILALLGIGADIIVRIHIGG